MTDRPTARPRRESGGDELPARIASRTVKRVLRRVASKAPAKSTGSTTQLATRMCQGFAAIVGEPRRVSALGAARRGAQDSSEREAEDGRDQAKRGRFECEGDSDLARGEADRLQQPDLAVLLAGARTDEDADDHERDDQKQDREQGDDYLRALSVA
jgi:hypothetical protein